MPPSVFIISVVKLSSCYHVFIVVKLLSWDLPTLPWVIFISFTVKKSSYYDIIMLLSSYCYCPSTPPLPSSLGDFYLCCQVIVLLFICYCCTVTDLPAPPPPWVIFISIIVKLSSCYPPVRAPKEEGEGGTITKIKTPEEEGEGRIITRL